MKWSEIENDISDEIFSISNREKTNIECPKCGKYIYRRTDIILTSYPPKYRYECDCGWVGSAYAKI